MTLKCSRREEGAADKAQKSKKAYPATETERLTGVRVICSDWN